MSNTWPVFRLREAETNPCLHWVTRSSTWDTRRFSVWSALYADDKQTDTSPALIRGSHFLPWKVMRISGLWAELSLCSVLCRVLWNFRVRNRLRCRWGVWKADAWTLPDLNAAKELLTQRPVCGYRTDWASMFLGCLSIHAVTRAPALLLCATEPSSRLGSARPSWLCSGLLLWF